MGLQMTEFQGFRGGVCGCRRNGGRLKKRYLKQSDAIKAAQRLPNDGYIYPCPTERRVWHVTGHPIDGNTYIVVKRGTP